MSTAAEEVANTAAATPLLLPELLTSVLEFSTFAEVHAVPRCVSREWRAAVRCAVTRGRWKPVKFVADQGEALLTWEAGRRGAVPTASCDVFRAAWAADPDEVFRICLTWTVDDYGETGATFSSGRDVFAPERAARFLAVVEPTIDGLGRIMALCERAYRFTYAGRKMEAAMSRDMYHDVEDYIVDHIIGLPVENPAVRVIFAWSREIRLSRAHVAHGFAVPRGLDVAGVLCDGLAAALEHWADVAVAAHFAASFFRVNSEARASIVATAQQISRCWEDRDKAADFAAAAFTVLYEDRQKRVRMDGDEESYANPERDEFWADLAPVVVELDETLHLAGNDRPTSAWSGRKVKQYYSKIAEMTIRPGDFY